MPLGQPREVSVRKYSLGLMLTLMLVASALTCVVTVVVTSLYHTKYSIASGGITKATQSLKALLEKIDEVYIGELDLEEASVAAMRSVVDSLGDRWSYYLTKAEYDEYMDRINNRYAGIGVGVTTNSSGMFIQYVYKGSPAEAAGIVMGDTVTAIDGESIAGMTLIDITGMLARPIGDEVELDILDESGVSRRISVKYEYIFTDPVYYEMLEGEIGYVALMDFDTGSAESFISAVKDLIGQGARAFIYDVRSNPGGMVRELTQILDYLLPEGDTFITVDKKGKETVEHTSGPDTVELPSVVLVNAHSYSAAEYFTAMLHEYGYAQTVGEQTTGKNRMQVTFVLPGGAALHISTSEYVTRDRVSLYDAGGYTPDYLIPFTEDEYAAYYAGRLGYDDDPQMQMALDLLKAR